MYIYSIETRISFRLFSRPVCLTIIAIILSFLECCNEIMDGICTCTHTFIHWRIIQECAMKPSFFWGGDNLLYFKWWKRIIFNQGLLLIVCLVYTSVAFKQNVTWKRQINQMIKSSNEVCGRLVVSVLYIILFLL